MNLVFRLAALLLGALCELEVYASLGFGAFAGQSGDMSCVIQTNGTSLDENLELSILSTGFGEIRKFTLFNGMVFVLGAV